MATKPNSSSILPAEPTAIPQFIGAFRPISHPTSPPDDHASARRA